MGQASSCFNIALDENQRQACLVSVDNSDEPCIRPAIEQETKDLEDHECSREEDEKRGIVTFDLQSQCGKFSGIWCPLIILDEGNYWRDTGYTQRRKTASECSPCLKSSRWLLYAFAKLVLISCSYSVLPFPYFDFLPRDVRLYRIRSSQLCCLGNYSNLHFWTNINYMLFQQTIFRAMDRICNALIYHLLLLESR